MLRYDDRVRQYIGERLSVPAEVFARVQEEMVAHAGLEPERALHILLDEKLWTYDRRAIHAVA